MLRSADDWDGQHFPLRADDAAPNAEKVFVSIDDHHSSGPTATIPDAHLLFNGDFKRAGSDLIVHDDNKSVIVSDYFAGDKRATLLSPEGAALQPHVVDALAGPMAPGQYAQAGGAQANAQAVGRVAAASGNATIVRNGVAIAAHTGDAVMKGDVLQTGTGTIGVTFNDGSTVNLTANARLVVNEFIYDPNGKANSEILDLVQGSLTFISGHVAHTGDMKIGTPVATMGIRGTIGGASNAADGSVHFYVSQSATGAVIIDSNGSVIANVMQDGPLIVVHPVGPLQVQAEEVQKSPAELAAEVAALQHIVSVQAVGQQLIQQFFQPNQNQNNPQSHGTDHTQIQIDIPKSAILPDNPDTGGTGGSGDTGNAVVTVTTTTTDTQTNTVDEQQQQIIVPIPSDLPPVIFRPPQQTITEDTSPVFSGQNGISVFDNDTPQLTVTLTATHGTLSLHDPSPDLVFSDGDGTDDITMNFSGPQAAINAALDGLIFTPTTDYSGPASIVITTTDGSKTATETVNITIDPVNDPPVVVLPANFAPETNEDTPLVISGIAVSDPDSGDALQVSLSVGHGKLSLTSDAGLTFTDADGSDGTLTFTGSQADINAALAHSIHYDPNQDFNGTDTLTVTVNDQWHDGSGDTPGGTETVDIAVTSVNDAPVIQSATATGNVDATAQQSSGSGVNADYPIVGSALLNGLGGPAGFGENILARNDDGSTGPIDVTSLFGPSGLNFFGHQYTTLYVNNNGDVTFGSPLSTYTPQTIGTNLGFPIIAPFWADVDTRGGTATPTPGGNSTGSDLVYYDLDTVNGVFTATWDDVGFYSYNTSRLDAFQLQLINRGGGDFDIVFRYEAINWTAGNASGGSGGLGGTPGRAGYSAGDNNPDHTYELPASGNQSQLLALPTTASNTVYPGVFVYHVHNGVVVSSDLTASGVIDFTDPDNGDVHSAASSYTGTDPQLGTLSLVKDYDIGSNGVGQFAWTYTVDNSALAYLGAGETKLETFLVTIYDGHGGSANQTVSVTLHGFNDPPVVTSAVTGSATENGAVSVLDALAHASDVDNGTTLTVVNVPDSLPAGVTYDDASHNFTLDPSDAAYQHLAEGQTATVTVDYGVSDGTATTPASVQWTVTGVNDAPVPVAGTATVSEEGLPGGIADSAGNTDTTDSPTAVGTIAATDAESDALTFSFGEPTTPLTSNGMPVTWEGMGTQLLTGSAGADTVITMAIDQHSGAYTVTLASPVDHADGSVEDVKTIDVPVNVSDGQATTTTSLAVDIEDDRPVAAPYMQNVTAGISSPLVNLVVVLDISGSMDAVVPGADSTRLELAQAALHNLLTRTDIQINQVMAVSFNALATVNTSQGSYWTDAASADSFIQGLQASGGTYYDRALNTVANRWGAGPGAADQTAIYFISDGQPSSNHGADTATWESFLTTHGVDASYAIGIGTSITDSDLTPIAWKPDNPDFPPVVLSEPTGLDSTLQNGVPPAEVHNILADDPGVGFGADGGHILSVEVDGVTYTWNGTDTITKSGLAGGIIMASMFAVDTALGGHFEFHFAADGIHAAGDWSYVQPDQVAQASQENFHYVLTDTDGDHAGADITIGVTADNYAPALDASHMVASDVPNINDTVVTGLAVSDANADPANDLFTLSASVDNGTLTFDNSVQDVAINGNGGSTPTVSGTLDSINTLFNAGVTYAPEGSPGNDKVVMTVDDQHGGHDNLTFVFNVNEPQSGQVALQGTAGKDVIFATGADDTLTGNGNSDTFVFAADAAGSHHITDFSLIDDFLQFHHSQFANIDAVLASATSDGAGDTVITDAAGTVTLDGVDHAQFQMIDHSHILIV